MTLRSTLLVSLALTLVGAPSLASAQDGQVVFVEDDGSQQVAVEQQPEQQPEQQRGLFQSGISLDIPVFVTDTEWYLPGVGVRGRWAIEFGYFVPEIEVGYGIMFTQNVVNEYFEPIDFHTNLWFAGGLRIQFLNASSILPWVSAGVDFDFLTWQDADTYDFQFGVHAAGGATIEITSQIGIDVGLEVRALVPVADHFIEKDIQLILYPKAGITYFYG